MVAEGEVIVGHLSPEQEAELAKQAEAAEEQTLASNTDKTDQICVIRINLWFLVNRKFGIKHGHS